MTIAISVKVNDGVVLAADSATSLIAQTPTGPAVAQVYNNANKVFNLRKSLPIAAITWGAGSIGRASISTVVKDLRVRLAGGDPAHKEWHLDPDSYTIEHVAARLRAFIYEELYAPAFKDWPQKPPLGFIVAGYSAGSELAEEYRIDIDAQGNCPPPVLLRPKNECGATWGGEPEAIARLFLGRSNQLAEVLRDSLGVPPDQVQAAMGIITQALTVPLVHDAMPIQDAIDLAEFFVDLTERFSRFKPGAPTVGGPIEIAAVTKHEGFRWVKRKYYFSRDLNPEGS